jgi:PST family polysaccharide transporter
MALPCVMALGRTRLLFQVSLVYALVHVPAFIAGTAFFGLQGTFWSLVAAGVFYTWLNAWMLNRTLGIRAGEIVTQLRRPLLAALAMAGAVLTTATLLPAGTTLLMAWLVMLIKIGVGGVTFCGVLVVLWRLEGKPAGIERRLLQVLERRRAGVSSKEAP